MAQLGNTVVNGSLRVVGDLYVNGCIDTTVTLTAAGWSGLGSQLYAQTVTVAGVQADNNYRVYKYISFDDDDTVDEIKDYIKNFGYITEGFIIPEDNQISFITITKPTANVTIRVVGDSNVEKTTVENTEVTSMKSDIASIYAAINSLNTRIYPVGSIYISVDNTNPGTLFGGTWEQIKDRFLLAAGNTYAAGSTGGWDTHIHKYGFQYGAYFGTISMEKDDQSGSLQFGTGNPVGSEYVNEFNSLVNNNAMQVAKNLPMSHYKSIADTSSASNMPPYLTVYVWKRTA